MSSSLPSKNTYYGNPSRNAFINGILVPTTPAATPTTVASNSSSMTTPTPTSTTRYTPSYITDNNSNSSNMSGVNNTDYRNFQHQSSVSSTQVGFFLFLLGLFGCAIFLYLLKNRIYLANANPSGNSQNASNTSQPQPNQAANEAFENMPPKERRHYIDSVLRVKVYEGPNIDDSECFQTITTNEISTEDKGIIPVETTTMESCCKHMNNNENESYDSDDMDTVLEEISIDYDDLENHGSTDSSSCSDIIADPINNSVNGAVPCCAICLEKFEMGDDISYSMDTTKCHHEYHTLCITEWLMKHPNCPYCRRNYIPLPSPSPSPPADAIDPVLTIVSSETMAAASTNNTLPDQSTPPSIPEPTLPQINSLVRTIGYPILWTSFWRRSQHQQQEVSPPDSVDIESGRISTVPTTTASVP